MKTNKNTGSPAMSAFLNKVMQDKKAIKEAIASKKSLSDLAKEKGINFAKPL